MSTIDHRPHLGEAKARQWESLIEKVEKDTKAYGKAIRRKAEELRGAPDAREREPLSVSALTDSSDQVRKAEVKAVSLADWGLADNYEVSKGMKMIDGWRKGYEKVLHVPCDCFEEELGQLHHQP
jgi:hypothetical protein